MKNVNIGIANLIISNKLQESYLNEELIGESKKVAFDFFNIVKASPALQLEFKVYNGIEEQHIENEMLAGKYIDEAVKLFEIFTIEEIEAEREKLSTFLLENVVQTINEAEYDLKKVDLYNAIDSVITETLRDGEKVNIDNLHESFVVVLNHIKEPRKPILENENAVLVNEDVIEIATHKFNEKYAGLINEDRELLQTLIKSTGEEKKNLFETYKAETLEILEGITDENAKDYVTKAIEKIKEMVYSQKEVDDNIIGLYELKKELI